MDILTVILVVFGVVVSLVVTVISVLGARKMVTGMLSPLLAQQAETRRLLAGGIPCAARVLQIEQTGTSVAVMGEQSYELRLWLEVTPPAAMGYRGMSTPYHAEMVSLVPMLAVPRVQPGCIITVRVDPVDPRKMVFEAASPPAQSLPYSGAAGVSPGYAPSAPVGPLGAPMPGHGAPAYGAPAHGAPAYGAPAYGPPGYGQSPSAPATGAVLQDGRGPAPAGYGSPPAWPQR